MKITTATLIGSLALYTFVDLSALAAPPMDCRRQMNIRAVTTLDFGTVLVSGAGQVVVDVNGARYSNGGVVTAGGTVSNAEFGVGGCKNWPYTIVVPPSATISNGSATMMVDNFVTSPTVGILDPKGKDTLLLGATLHVNDAQQAGAYSGSYIVEVIGQ